MADKADLRISDADREREAAVLREHYAAGRLDSSEFEERLQAVYDARTEGELESLRSDLPPLPPKPPTTMELARQTFDTNILARYCAAGCGAFAACTAIWALTGADGSDFWPKWVLIFTLVTFVRGGRQGARRGRRIGQAGGGRITPGGEGGGAGGDGHSYSYRYEYQYGHGQGHRHEHQHGGGEE